MTSRHSVVSLASRVRTSVWPTSRTWTRLPVDGPGFVAPTFDSGRPDIVVVGDVIGSHDDYVDITLFVSLAPCE